MILVLLRLSFWSWVCACAVFCGALRAQELDFGASQERVELAARMDLLEDPAGIWTPEQALARPDWRPATLSLMNRGSTEEAVWLRLRVVNRSRQVLTRWLTLGNPRLEHLAYHRYEADGVTLREFLLAGIAHAPREPLVAGKAAIFAVRLEPGEQAHLLLRVQGRTLMLMWPELWEPLAYREHEAASDGLYLVSVTAVVTVAFYLLLHALAHRDRQFLLLAVWLLLGSAYDLTFNGYLRRYGWPEGGEWLARATPVLAMAAHLANLGFMYLYLEIHRHKLWCRIYRLMMGALLVCALSSAWGDLRQAISWSTLMLTGIYLVWPFSLLPGWRTRRPFIRIFTLSIAGLWFFNLMRIMITRWGAPDAGLMSWYVTEVYKFALGLALLFGVVRQSWRQSQALRAAQAALLRARQREQARLEEAVRLRSQALEEAVLVAGEAHRAKSELLMRVSHDLRAPLNAMMGYAHILASQGRASGAAALRVERHSKRLLTLINGLIDYARGGAQADALRPQSLYTSAFLRSMVSVGERLAQRHGNHFAFESCAGLPEVVEADSKRLRQVLEHLLQNAAEFTRQGRIELRVAIQEPTASGAALAVVFTVSDTGVGMTARQLQHLFEPFLGLGPQESHKGMGLGLAIVYQWVRRMGGCIQATSTPGQGTAMRLVVPLKPSSEDRLAPRHLAREEGEQPELQGAGRAIWVVDDSRALRDMLCADLRRQGFVVQPLAGGDELARCIGRPAQPRPDLILTDLEMPCTDGLAVLRMARARWPDLPVILLSGAFDIGPQPEFSATLAKPLSLTELRHRLAELLDLSIQAPCAMAEREPAPGVLTG